LFNIATTNKTLYKICFLQALYKWLGLFAVDATGDKYNVGRKSVSKKQRKTPELSHELGLLVNELIYEGTLGF